MPRQPDALPMDSGSLASMLAPTSAVRAARHGRLSAMAGRIAAGMLLVLLAPLLIALAIVLRYTLGTPSLVWRLRQGLRGRPFRLYSFATMRPPRKVGGGAGADWEWLSPIGWWLRRTGFERLPQLYNIARGNLAWFGPRPLPHGEECATFSQRCLLVKPGLIALSDVSGGDLLMPHEKQAIDAWHVRRASSRLSAEIALRALVAVVTGHRRDEALISAARREMWGCERSPSRQSDR